MTDEVTQHDKMRQTSDTTALDDLSTLGIPELQECSRIPQEGVRVFIEAIHEIFA